MARCWKIYVPMGHNASHLGARQKKRTMGKDNEVYYVSKQCAYPSQNTDTSNEVYALTK